MVEGGSPSRDLKKRHRSTSREREHRHHRSHRDVSEKKHRHVSPRRSKSPDSKRRKNDDVSKVKKSHDDDIEEGESTANDTRSTTANNNDSNNGATTSKRVPLSLEEMLEKNKKEKEAISKPKFITKEEREAAAIKRRQEEADAIRQRNDELRKKHTTFNKEAEQLAAREDRERERERRERERDRHRREKDDQTEKPVISVPDAEREEAAVKERYLGIVKKKRKVRSLNDRKFVFDWDVAEDTAVDYNPIYKEKHQIQLFGRGHIAGIDINKQKKDQSKFYGMLLEERRTQGEKDREV
ncbi:unnamed protein product [Rotaria magnacalcarata]|uniref:PRP28/DDX23-like helical domain-containing protein n=17 Tax=Rotaria magnacalcarata TaxID=392030 RepID=A0A819VQF7_9BILA|nr:unnamed protein product [Rotaria magnacalcarata]